ncbi:MAG: 2-oxoglutarate synthase [Acidobacteria bacterium]|nr:2-oxoglutarate synthase [Acidobacteriota bacterium]
MSLIRLEDLPFCPGCSHEAIFRALDAGLDIAGLGSRDAVVVSDIGCQGIADSRIDLSTFHGLHGRSITYATGIKLARPDLRVIVLIGDGGCGIGGAHLINAARRNVGICVLVFNNFNFGMTGGQHSVTTPTGARTATTPGGNIERPFDLRLLAEAAGAGFTARMIASDPDLPEVIARAIAHDGFAMLDVWGICTAHYMKRNDLRMAGLADLARATPGYGITLRDGVPEYASSLPRRRGDAPRLEAVPTKYRSPLDSRLGVVLAGSAGMKVGTAASLVARAGVLSGLYAAQKSVIPVTVMKGFSLAEIILAPEPIEDLQVGAPDRLVISSADGLEKSRPLHGAAGRITIEHSLEPRPPGAVPLRLDGVRRTELTFAMAASAVADAVPQEALVEAIETWGPLESRPRLLAAAERGRASRAS